MTPCPAAFAIPGAIGAFLGSTLLVRLSTEAARPIMSLILALIGLNLMWRFSRGLTQRKAAQRPHSTGFLAGLGLFGGFVDATGGGGWGPVTTSTLLSAGRAEPRRIVGTVNMVDTRHSATRSQTCAGSKRSAGSRIVLTPRATWVSWCTPAPCDRGATTKDASSPVSPGIRSARWFVTTKAICPWVRTEALGRPVVPEVKKNQQGSSRSTAATCGRWPM